MTEHTMFLALWLGTGGSGLLFGLLGVRLAKRRLRVRLVAAAVPAVTEEELVAA